MQTFNFQVSINLPFEQAIESVISTLKNEGFGVLTRIDVRETLKQKLNTDFRPYVILGACNPPLAYQALQSDPLVGLLLPCNVTVESTGNASLVSIINPEVMLSVGPMAGNEKIVNVAIDARERLERVVSILKGVDKQPI